jgi:hypothetical protein
MSNTRFGSFPKPQFKIDTIPKPVGLGSRSSREGHSVQCVFIEYSMNIRWLLNACSISLKASWFANGR